MAMLHYQTLIVPTDFSPSAARALDLALDLASRTGATVRVLHVASPTGAEGLPRLFRKGGSSEEQERGTATEMLESFVQRHTGSLETPPEVSWELVSGSKVASEILQYAEAEEADLVVMGTHGRHSIEHFLFGGVADEVLRRAEMPVLTVRGAETTMSGTTSLGRVLVPVDFSRYSGLAVTTGKSFARWYGGQVTLLFVEEERMVPVFSDTGLPAVTVLRMEPEMLERAREALRQLADRAQGPDVSTETLVRSGNVVQEILAQAEAEADLIVLTSPGLSGADPSLLGTVVERVIRRAKCPVLLIKAFGRPIPLEA